MPMTHADTEHTDNLPVLQCLNALLTISGCLSYPIMVLSTLKHKKHSCKNIFNVFKCLKNMF